MQQVSKFRQGPPLGSDIVDCGAMVMPRQLEIVQVGVGVTVTARLAIADPDQDDPQTTS